MSHLCALIASLAGFAALALAMDRQQRDLFGRELAAGITRRLRLAGTALLLIALAVDVAVHGWALGLVDYSGHTSLAAAIVYCALIVRLQVRR